MPTPVVSSDKMQIGAKGGGKHWTRAEVEARQQAADETRRPGRVILRPPDWLDEKALEVWKKTKRAIKDLEILDNVDSDMLAMYCNAVARFGEHAKIISTGKIGDEELKPQQYIDLEKATTSYARLALSLAEKLGLTPNGRARLAKKKAEPVADQFADEFG